MYVNKKRGTREGRGTRETWRFREKFDTHTCTYNIQVVLGKKL